MHVAHTRIIHMCRVFASYTRPVCSRRGRHIVNKKMAKGLLVEVYEEVDKVHHNQVVSNIFANHAPIISQSLAPLD